MSGTWMLKSQSLVIVRLADGKMMMIPGVRSFRLPKDNGTSVAYLAARDSTPAAPRQYGSSLVLHNLDTGTDDRIADVLAYTFDDSATVFAYTVVSRDSTRHAGASRSWNAHRGHTSAGVHALGHRGHVEHCTAGN